MREIPRIAALFDRARQKASAAEAFDRQLDLRIDQILRRLRIDALGLHRPDQLP